jgi:hypothetical protein
LCYLFGAVLESFIFYHVALHLKKPKALWDHLNSFQVYSFKYLN